jgi:hypothetical protein
MILSVKVEFSVGLHVNFLVVISKHGKKTCSFSRTKYSFYESNSRMKQISTNHRKVGEATGHLWHKTN